MDLFGFGQMAGAAGGIFNNERNISAAQEANAQNMALSRENRDWSEKMTRNAHQLEVADLKAAGLNPVLSAGGGNGASVPSSAAAQVDAPKSDISSVSKGLTEALHSQLMGAQVKKETANAISSGAQASVAAEKAKNEVEGGKAKNDWTRAQTMIAKSLAPERKEALKAGNEAGGMWKAGRTMWNRLPFSSAFEAATSGQWGADLYDATHKENEGGASASW